MCGTSGTSGMCGMCGIGGSRGGGGGGVVETADGDEKLIVDGAKGAAGDDASAIEGQRVRKSHARKGRKHVLS